MDDVARYNQQRWEELAQANVQYSRPALDLDADSARAMVDPEGVMADVAGRDVLCLAGGGGQQSAAFALLGANVTVLDLTPTQLDRDREAAAHYGTDVRTVQGDMRDLSCFDDAAFELVWQAHSLNFVPDARTVFGEVARVLRPGGQYRLHCVNPFIHSALDPQWNGSGYPLTQPFVDGARIEYPDTQWDVDDGAGNVRRIEGPQEFRHALSTLINGLIERGLTILGCWETADGDTSAEPGSWAHFKAFAPPWLTIWAKAHAQRGPAGMVCDES